jgi:molybdenum cofactor guanylyltransferase
MLKAVILCGGKSTRMGKDKGTLLLAGITWAEHAAATAKEAGLEVIISVNEDQVSQYTGIFGEQHLVTDQCDKAEGPLKGILTVHKEFPDADLLILACDMIALSALEINELMSCYKQGIDNFCIFGNDGLHPFPGIYKKQFLNKIHTSIADNPVNFSITRFLRSFPGKVIVSKNNKRFINVNSRQDLEGLG